MEYTSLSISIFCDTDNNYLVLRKGILTKVRQLQRAGLLKNWYFDFSNNGGSNIITPMLVQTRNINNTVEKIAKYFNSFFDSNFDCHPKPILIEDLYQPFPVNSIQFGLYKATGLFDNPYISLKQTISDIYIEALCKEPVYDEALLSLSLYLYLMVIKEALASHQGAEQIREFLLDTSESFNTDIEVQEELKNLLTAIVEDIGHHTKYNREISFLNKWEQVCKSRCYLNEPIEIFKLINKHLQLSENVLSIVIYLTSYYINRLS